jgi:hypothetical protein
VAGARVRAAGATALTGSDGIARLRVRPRRAGIVAVTASKEQLMPGRATLRAIRH